jgi:hypothetical protein
MLFTPALVAKILAGEKTQTRRVVKPVFERWPIEHVGLRPISSVRRNGRYLWRVGRVYAVQPGRGKHAVARIRITAIRYCARAGDISEADARAEGFESVAQFREVYAKINGAAALERPCWALTFAAVRLDGRSTNSNS